MTDMSRLYSNRGGRGAAERPAHVATDQVARRTVPHTRLGRHVRFTEAHLAAIVDGGERGALESVRRCRRRPGACAEGRRAEAVVVGRGPGRQAPWSHERRRRASAHPSGVAARPARRSLYEIVLQEGGLDDVRRRVNGAELVRIWDRLYLPPWIRAAWTSLIAAASPAAEGRVARPAPRPDRADRARPARSPQPGARRRR